MSGTGASRTIIAQSSRPVLARHVKLRQDAVRGRWVILAPERVFTPDAVAVAVLQLCDGSRSVGEIAGELAQTYNAPIERILSDITELLQGLADKGVVAS